VADLCKLLQTPQLDLSIAAAQGTAPEIERKSRKTIGFLAERACIASPFRYARSAPCLGGDFTTFSEFLHPAFRPLSRMLSDHCCLVAQPDRPAHRLWRVGHATTRAGLAATQGRNDREQLHQATSDLVSPAAASSIRGTAASSASSATAALAARTKSRTTERDASSQPLQRPLSAVK
jgi:hypothetical protein